MARGEIASDVPVLWLVVPPVALFGALATASVVARVMPTEDSPAFWFAATAAGALFAALVAIAELIAVLFGTIALIRRAESRSLANVVSILFGAGGGVISTGIAFAVVVLTELRP